jgi:hypothetical protein
MAIRQFIAGQTYSISFNFFDDLGFRTPIDSPVVSVYTPHRTAHINAAGLSEDSLVIGRYNYNFYSAPGLTFGHWFALASGITNSSTIFSESVPFEIIDLTSEPFWLGLTEFRDYLEIPDDDHTRDSFHKQMLQSSIELIEAYTRRIFGVRGYSEKIEIKHTDRVHLKHFPIVSISALTATSKITPKRPSLLVEIVSDQLVPFNFRSDDRNGVLLLTDTAGFDSSYDGVLLAITYEAGFLTIPEPIRMAGLALASKLANLATSEGIDSVRLADLNFALQRELISGTIADMINPYKVINV